MSSAISNTKFLAGKVGEFEIGTKLMNTGNVVAESGSNLVDKAAEVAVNIFLIFYFIKKKSERVESFAKRLMMGLIFLLIDYLELVSNKKILMKIQRRVNDKR